MFTKLFDACLDMIHHLIGKVFYKVDAAKRRRNKKVTFKERVSERAISLVGKRGVTRKW